MKKRQRMQTPICDFVRKYAEENAVRFHMPGHKGREFLGVEHLDITEIAGADSLYEAEGIIRESEKNASSLFGTADTLYSAEGSSLCIRAMLYLACQRFRERSKERPVIVAARNSHRVFLTAATLLDFDIVWLWPENETYSLCRCKISESQLEEVLSKQKNVAGVYITSPDYLGNCADIAKIAEIAHKYEIPLLVDDAHGAYRRFLEEERHPILDGADICCDSAHKTLPVLTGGAYLHLSKHAPKIFHEKARMAMALFGSTSPSYLIMQSLDRANRYLFDGYRERLARTVQMVKALKEVLRERGWSFLGNEPLKLTIEVKKYGYTGAEIEEYLLAQNIVCEYADPDYVVFMLTPENTESDFEALKEAMYQLDKREALKQIDFEIRRPEVVMTVREAVFAKSIAVPVERALGKVITSWNSSCPPAVSPLIPGEVMTEQAVEIFKYYGIDTVEICKE